MKKYFKILQKCPLFAEIEEDELLRMLSCLGARILHYDKKSAVLKEGTPAHWIGIVLYGSVQTTQVDYYGNRSILSYVGEGEIFAEAFACAHTASLPVDIIANETCEVMLIDSEHILHTCANHCAFHQRLIYNLMQDLADKTIRFHRRMEITAKRTTREKLLTYLLLEAKDTNSSQIDIPFDRQELADYLEVDRSGLSAEISKLRREGVLISNKNHFELL